MSLSYDTPDSLLTYLQFHYGTVGDFFAARFEMDRFENFHTRVLERFLRRPSGKPGSGQALDLGCNVGRATFELSRQFDQVVGIDFSAQSIEIAERIRSEGEFRADVWDARQPGDGHTFRVPDGCRPGAVQFKCGDACHANLTGKYDCVVALNLLCRVADPLALVQTFEAAVADGGQLILSTPWSWDEKYTPRSAWPGDVPGPALESLLGASFERTGEEEMPFLMRAATRQYYWCVAYGSSWTRRPR